MPHKIEVEHLISVVIPNYNGEKYLARCLDSIINQGIDAEIIVVDDGSKDNSLNILEQYKTTYGIKLISKENGGVSSARNAGIDAATGEYVCFVDSDDCLEPNAFKTMLKELGDNDLLVYSYSDYFLSGEIVPKRQLEGTVSGPELRNNLFLYASRAHLYGPWNKLIKTSLLQKNNVYFPVGIKAGEDYIFNIRVIKYVKSAKFINDTLYCYYENQSSVTHHFDKNHWLEQVQMIQETYLLAPLQSNYESEFIIKRFYGVYGTYAHQVKWKELQTTLSQYWNKCYKNKDMSNIPGKFVYRFPIHLANSGHFNALCIYFLLVEHAISMKHKIRSI